MHISEVKELLEYLNKNKEMLTPVITEVVSLAESIGVALEPTFKKVMITKSVEYTTEKFKLLCDNGFTRQEAISIMLHDRAELKEALTQKKQVKNG